MVHAAGYIFLLIITGTFFLGFAAADMGPLLRLQGGVGVPKTRHESIRLESQEVTIRLKETSYSVDAVFHFFNTGEVAHEWVGFPKRVSQSDACSARPNLMAFQVWADGGTVPVAQEREASSAVAYTRRPSQTNHWMVCWVTFAAGRTTTIRCSYEALYEVGFSQKTMSYLYGTGSYWKGNVGSAVFLVDATDIGGQNRVVLKLAAAPGPREVSRNLVMFEMRDFKPAPEGELEVVVLPKRPEALAPY